MTSSAWGHHVDVVDAIRGRRAVRNYHDLSLRRDEIEAVLNDAVWAPSSMNRQPWRFLVIEGRQALAAAGAEARSQLLKETDSPGLRGFLEQPGFRLFYNAPALIVVLVTQPDAFARQDGCLAAATLMLSAHGRGLGTCWIGLAEAWLNLPATKARLGVAPECVAIAPIVIGRPAIVPEAPARSPVSVTFADWSPTPV